MELAVTVSNRNRKVNKTDCQFDSYGKTSSHPELFVRYRLGAFEMESRMMYYAGLRPAVLNMMPENTSHDGTVHT